MTPAQPKIWIIQLMRAVAALLVMISHLFAQWWSDSALSFAAFPKDSTPVPSWIPSVYESSIFYSLGTYAVAIFFLISGVVIPYSLEAISARMFLWRRFMRIYPVLLIGVLWSLTCYYIASLITGKAIPFDVSAVLHTLLLTDSVAQKPSILSTSWTLEIEAKFYLLIALFSVKNLAIRVVSCVVVSCLLHYIPAYETWWISYILIGTLYVEYKKGNIPAYGFHLYWLSCLIAGSFFLKDNQIMASAYALLTCGLVFTFQHKFHYHKIVNFFANISYPLYIMHSTFGYLLLFLLDGYNYYVRSILVSIIMILLSYLVHKAIEQPCLIWSKRTFTYPRCKG